MRGAERQSREPADLSPPFRKTCAPQDSVLLGFVLHDIVLQNFVVQDLVLRNAPVSSRVTQRRVESHTDSVDRTMNPFAIAAVLVSLVATSTAIGLVWRSTTGRIRAVAGGDERIHVSEISADAVAGSGATLLQFSTEFCSPCRTTNSQLGALAAELPGITHVDVDVTTRPDLADRFNLLQSPTTFILDGTGAVRARIGGAPRIADVRAELGRILEAA